MTYLVDSDVVIDYLGGRREAVALLQHLEPHGLSLSILTFAEVYEGIYRSRDPKTGERRFREVLKRMSIIAVSRRVALRGARIRGGSPCAGTSVTDD